MIRLEDPGERGGRLTVSMSPFDLLSLFEGIENGVMHLDHLIAQTKSDSPFYSSLVAKREDGIANLRELTNVKDDRERLLP